MNALILAEFYGALLIFVGLTGLNKKYITSVVRELENSCALFWVTGLFTFTIGFVSLHLYSTWSSNWQVIITIFGWLTLLKGIAMTVFSPATKSFYKKTVSGKTAQIIGIIALIAGVILVYVGVVS